MFSSDCRYFFDSGGLRFYRNSTCHFGFKDGVELTQEGFQRFSWHLLKNLLCAVTDSGLYFYKIKDNDVAKESEKILLGDLSAALSPYGSDPEENREDLEVVWFDGSDFIIRCCKSLVFRIRREANRSLEVIWNLQLTEKSFLFQSHNHLFFFVPESKTLSICNPGNGAVEKYIELGTELRNESVFSSLTVSLEESALGLATKDSVFVMKYPTKPRSGNAVKFEKIIQKKSFIVEAQCISARKLVVLFTSEVLSARLYRVYDIGRNSLLYETQIAKAAVVSFVNAQDYPDVLFKDGKFKVLGVSSESDSFVYDEILQSSENQAKKRIDFLCRWNDDFLSTAFLTKALKAEKFHIVQKFLDLRYVLNDFREYVFSGDTSSIRAERQHVAQVLEIIHDAVRNNFENANKQAFITSLANAAIDSVSISLDKVMVIHQEIVIPKHILPDFNKIQCEFISLLIDFSFDLELLTQKSQEYLSKKKQRKHLSSSQSSTRSATPEVRFLCQSKLELWRNMSVDEVVEDSLASNLIPLAQVYCRKEREKFLTLDAFKEKGRVLLEKLAGEGSDLKTLQSIAMSVGAEILPTVTTVFLKVRNSEKRKCAYKCLNELGPVPDTFRKAHEFLNQIEEIIRGKQSRTIGSLPLTEEVLKIKDYEKTNLNVGKVLAVTNDQRNSILAELFFVSKDPQLQGSVKPGALWKYLLSRNMIAAIKEWTREFACSVNDTEVGASQNMERQFPDWQITSEMIEEVHSIPDNFKEDLMNEFGKYGIFSETEKRDVKLLLKRLEKTESLAKIEALLSLPTAVTTPQEFHRLYVCYCLQNDLEKPLSDHMNRYNLSSRQVMEFVLESEIDLPDWFDDLMKVRKWEENPTDVLMSYEALLVELKQESVRNDCSVSELLCTKPMEVIGMQILEDLLVESSRVITAGLLRTAVEQVPLLKQALKRVESPAAIDCTVYDLLRSATALDMGKSFTWRVENRYANSGTSLYPFVSDPHFIKDHAHQPRLDYLYYLMNGRPSFAFFKFVDDCEISPRSASKTSYAAACSLAHVIALMEFRQQHLTQSCVAFLDMLGKDTTPLRCSIFVLEKSYNHELSLLKDREKRIAQKNALDEAFQKIASGLVKKDVGAARDLAKHFEVATAHEVRNMTGYDNLLRILGDWKAYLAFCQFYELRRPTSLVEYIVESNSLVNFCVGVRYLEYDAVSVSELIGKHPESSLAAYAGYAFRMADRLATLTDSERSGKRTRRRLYSTGAQKQPEAQSLKRRYAPMALDFFDVLREAEQVESPAEFLCSEAVRCRNQVFAVLASGFEGFSFVNGICSAVQSLLQLHGYTGKKFEAVDMHSLLYAAVNQGYSAWVAELMETLLPEHPLSYLFDWLAFFFDLTYSHDESLVRYKVFHGALLDITYDALLNIEPELVSTDWLQSFCSSAVKGFVASPLVKGAKMLDVLHILVDVSFSEVFKGPDYAHILKILQVTLKAPIMQPHLPALVSERNSIDYKTETKRIIDTLVSKRRYSDALSLATIVGSNVEDVQLNQIKNEYVLVLSDSVDDRLAYRKKCESQLAAWRIKPETLAVFYSDQAGAVDDVYEEKAYLLTMALKWQKGTSVSSELEKELWRTWLPACEAGVRVDLKQVYSLVFEEGLPLYEDLLKLRGSVDQGYTGGFSSEAVQSLVETLLNHEVLKGAISVESNFSAARSKDVELILAAISVLEGSADADIVLSTLSHLLTANNRTVLNNERLVANDIESMIAKDATPIVRKHIAFFHRVEDALTAGQTLMSRIRELYCLTDVLGVRYKDLAKTSKPEDVLDHILKKGDYSLSDRQKLAACWVSATQLKNEKVVNVVMCHLQEAIRKAHSCGSVDEDASGLSFSLLQSICSHWTNLCNPPSSLGELLLSEGSQCEGTADASDEINLGYIIECCILAHTAFSQACDIEGIGRVLRRAKVLTNTLTRVAKWGLMVRLLTGIQRYAEMAYVFTILYNHDQFEYLLGKGMDRQPQFKVALIHFLKKYCTENKELFRLVALNFHLYDEVALLWEEEAKQGLKTFLAKSEMESSSRPSTGDLSGLSRPASKSSVLRQLNFASPSKKGFTVRADTKKHLVHMMHNLSHAAEFYIQADLLQKARECTFKAQEVAAQIALVNSSKAGESTPLVVGLSASELSNLLAASSISCHIARVLIEASENQVDVCPIVWRRYILQGEDEWLDLILTDRELVPDSVLEELIQSHESHGLPVDARDRLKRLVTMADNTATTYKLAKALQMGDVVSRLKLESASPFLKDQQMILS